MQLFILILFLGLFAHDEMIAVAGAGAGPDAGAANSGLPIGPTWLVLALSLGAKCIFGFGYWMICRKAKQMMESGDSTKAQDRLNKLGTWTPYLILILFKIDLALVGLLVCIRSFIGNTILIDELLAIAPTLALVAWTWSSNYAIDRYKRESRLIGDLDKGEPVQIWTKPQFLLTNIRHHWALMGVPLVMMLGCWELIHTLNPGNFTGDQQASAMFGCTLVVFLFTPILIRHVWDTIPLPDGETRQRLTAMCEKYNVKVKELLLWRTYGTMINGAVMGVVGQLRYILLTDALLEQLPEKQVEAVMAHELAHVRKKHIFWLMVVAITSLILLQIGWTYLTYFVFQFASSSGVSSWLPRSIEYELREPNHTLIEWIAVFFSMICWFLLFGWVSRRIERQADTFAVQHFMTSRDPSDTQNTSNQEQQDQSTQPDIAMTTTSTGMQTIHKPSDLITETAAATMCDALGHVAALNHMPIVKTRWWHMLSMSAWRHGTIAWRQAYLRSLPGQSIHQLPVDKQIFWIKIAAALGVATLVVLHLLELA